ncbi:MAG TPA: energy transducer TonB [Terriglobales bacterium]|nr:energy transducer TonB [Terriglobales bacterium]
MSEQRLFLRKKVSLPIPIELLPGKEMWLHDIGEGGLSVSGSSRLEPGTATFFSFQFPDANSMIEASGVVAWCDGSGRVGIRFTRIKPDSSALLKRWLKNDDKQSSSSAERSTAERATADLSRAGIEGDAANLRQEIARTNLDSSGAFDLLVGRMKDRTRASGAAIALQEQDSVICRASSGNAPPAGTPLNIDNTVTGECYRSGNIVSITDTEKDARVDSELCRQLEFRSLLIVPIARGEEVVGILEVFSPLAGNFEGGDVLLLGSIAEVVSEIYGAQQRGPSPPAPDAQEIPFLVNERIEQLLQSVDTHGEEKQESDPPDHHAAQNSATPSTGEDIEARDERASETREAPPSLSSNEPTSSRDERNEARESRWKPRNYVLLMAGLTALGIGMGDIVDWHVTSRLARASAQSAVAANEKNGAPAPTSELKLTEDANGFDGSKTTASLSPPEAVPLAGPVPNLDARAAAQLTPAKLLHRVDPVVPDFAKSAGIDATVLLSAVIGTDGKLKDVKFVSGDRALAIEAFRALRDWRYRPYMLNGKPIEAETRIVMNFRP